MSKPRKVLVLGSGALKIGEAGEFDYSGSQALRALKEENISTILVNPNIATNQTSEGLADKIYFFPVTPFYVEQIIEETTPDAILLSCGGQTALNCGLALADNGILKHHGIEVLGTPIEVIRNTEDRELFKSELLKIGVLTPFSLPCKTANEIREAVKYLNYPFMLRGSFSLGGRGSAIVKTEEELEEILLTAFSAFSPETQILVEECLVGWKEIEWEIIIDKDKNCAAICNMENMDPMGVHTGESIVVTPSQTLNNQEYHFLRKIALDTIKHLGIVGECNIQFALNPKNHLDYKVIEVNARLSRSSALASKATGYPLAWVSTKLSLGYRLDEVRNEVTKTTKAFFEPALDYCVVKIPRWDLEKFPRATYDIGSSMKSIGEVMAVGRNFPEALQKALRMLQIGVDGLDERSYRSEKEIEDLIKTPNPYRIFAIADALRRDIPIQTINDWSGINLWFIYQINGIIRKENWIDENWEQDLFSLKLLGFSDKSISKLISETEEDIRKIREIKGIYPVRRQIDTMAAEWPSLTNYLYFSYDSKIDEALKPTKAKPVKPSILVLGSGVYHIGSSVEFDWCCVTALKTCRNLGYRTIMLNNNPETVSTDFDVCDCLIFDEINLENILAINKLEKLKGVIISVGGQTANNLALDLEKEGIPILGTSAKSIDIAEDRDKFSSLCDTLGIDQPRWAKYTSENDMKSLVGTLNFPLLVRPSYVLSGSAMQVVNNESELKNFIEKAVIVSPKHPVVISEFERNSKEIEVDAVANQGKICVYSIAEHVENAGVHSGDSTMIIPPQRIYLETLKKIKDVTKKLARALNITGPFNIQFLARNNEIKVIECNLRASRSFPFTSKANGDINFIEEATLAMLGRTSNWVEHNPCLDLDRVCVKAPQFSFSRITGADPTLGVEMMSTGEVGCFGMNVHEALLKAMIATGFVIPTKGVLLSIGGTTNKEEFLESANILVKIGLKLFGTAGTFTFFNNLGINIEKVFKQSEEGNPSVVDLMLLGEVDLVINIPSNENNYQESKDGYKIRRKAIDLNIPLITNQQLIILLIKAMSIEL